MLISPIVLWVIIDKDQSMLNLDQLQVLKIILFLNEYRFTQITLTYFHVTLMFIEVL